MFSRSRSREIPQSGAQQKLGIVCLTLLCWTTIAAQQQRKNRSSFIIHYHVCHQSTYGREKEDCLLILVMFANQGQGYYSGYLILKQILMNGRLSGKSQVWS